MEYYQITQNTEIPVSISCGFDHNIIAIAKKNYGEVADMSMYRMQASQYSYFPDMIFMPVFMVSEMAYQCIRMYEPYIRFKRLLLYDEERVEIFYIPLLEKVNSLNNKKELFNRHLFFIEGKHSESIILSLDLLESLLKRKFIGFTVIEMQMR